MVEAVERYRGELEYLWVDIERFKKVGKFLGIKSVPVTYLIKNGELEN